MNDISEMLSNMIKIGNVVEMSRQNLALRPDYNHEDHFGFINKSEDQKTADLSFKDFRVFLGDIGLKELSKSYGEVLFEAYRSESDPQMGINQFYNLVAPEKEEYQLLLECRSPRKKSGLQTYQTYFTKQTQKMIKNVFFNLLERIRIDVEARNKMNYNRDDLAYIYKLIDHDKSGLLTPQKVS